MHAESIIMLQYCISEYPWNVSTQPYIQDTFLVSKNVHNIIIGVQPTVYTASTLQFPHHYVVHTSIRKRRASGWQQYYNRQARNAVTSVLDQWVLLVVLLYLPSVAVPRVASKRTTSTVLSALILLVTCTADCFACPVLHTTLQCQTLTIVYVWAYVLWFCLGTICLLLSVLVNLKLDHGIYNPVTHNRGGPQSVR